ncbi:MAG: Tad domain-containing protein [Microthrixaceae bacterium]
MGTGHEPICLAGSPSACVDETCDVQEPATQHTEQKRPRERAMVLVWMGLMLVTLLAVAGFSVDLANWWLQSERLQRAVDAGAHAGVVFLPGDVTEAKLKARRETARNEFNDGILSGEVNASVFVEQLANPYQLRVESTTTVDNFFLKLIGMDDLTITRDATAEFEVPVPMGSPLNKMGNDPETGYTTPQFWMNLAGPNTNKDNGDRFQAKNCSSGAANCDGTANPGITNDDYNFDGYIYALEVKSVPSGGEPLRIDVYDALYAYQGDKCTSNNDAGNKLLPSDSENTTLTAWYGDAEDRYDRSLNNWCPGDQRLQGNANVQTTFIVREPDDTPWSDTDNPIVNTSTCSPLTLQPYDLYDSSEPTIFEYLHPSDGVADAEAVFADDGNLTFAEMFHRWATICEIPAADVEEGQYLLQVRSNADETDPTLYDASETGGGHNRMSLRVGFGSPGVAAEDGSNVAMYALGKMPIYANAQAADTNFDLARVLPGDAGRTLRIYLWDISDVGESGTMQVLAPTETAGSFSGCTFSVEPTRSITYDSSTCTLTVPNGDFNKRLIAADIPIPDDYTCDDTDPEGCWIRILASFPGAVQDTTTWSAAILGSPVRLVE